MATDALTVRRPDWAVHPGEILAEALEERAITQATLARRMDRPLKTINEIVKGKAAVTPDTALQLELVLGIPARLWNNLQRDYSEARARVEERRRLEKAAGWVDRFPLREMARRGWLPAAASKAEAVAILLRYFAVGTPAAWERQWSNTHAAFRRSPAHAPSEHAIAAWLRRGEIKASESQCAPFDAGKLRLCLPAIRKLVQMDPVAFMPRVRVILSSCGVVLVMTKELPGTHLYGAARWLAPDRAIIQLSLRHGTDDQFWFALFHEIGHLLRGGPRSSFIDLQGSAEIDPDETAADRFAANQLIAPADFERFKKTGQFERQAIEAFAYEIAVSPGVVLGRLQREGALAPSRLNYLKRRWTWADS